MGQNNIPKIKTEPLLESIRFSDHVILWLTTKWSSLDVNSLNAVVGNTPKPSQNTSIYNTHWQGTAKCIISYREDSLNLFSLLYSSSSRKHSHDSTGIDPLKPGWQNNRPMFRVRCSNYVTESVNLQCSQARGKKFRLGVTIIIAPVDSVIHNMHLDRIEWILLGGWEGRVGPIIIVIRSTSLGSIIIRITSTPNH